MVPTPMVEMARAYGLLPRLWLLTWLITSELANQRAQKVLFTCVVYTKLFYYVVTDEL